MTQALARASHARPMHALQAAQPTQRYAPTGANGAYIYSHSARVNSLGAAMRIALHTGLNHAFTGENQQSVSIQLRKADKLLNIQRNGTASCCCTRWECVYNHPTIY
jgi:hypothetical protein